MRTLDKAIDAAIEVGADDYAIVWSDGEYTYPFGDKWTAKEFAEDEYPEDDYKIVHIRVTEVSFDD